jgi:hypothetical protein
MSVKPLDIGSAALCFFRRGFYFDDFADPLLAGLKFALR